MSKLVKGLVQKEIAKRLGDVDGVAVINPRGIDAIKNNLIRRRLRAKGVRMTVVKNTLARRAVPDGSKLKGFDALLDGPSAVIYGEASIATIARMLLAEKKTDEKIELRGIFFDGELYAGDKGVEQVSKLPTREEAIGQIVALILDEKKADEKIELRGIFFDGELYTGDKGVEQVSKLPTREEAIGQVVALILAPGSKLAGTLKGQAGKIAALVKAIEEKAEKAGGAAAAPEAAAAPDAAPAA